MVRKSTRPIIPEDAPELTEAELAEMRPAAQALPPELFAMLTKRKPGQRGPGKKPSKVLMTIRVDAETLAAYKASGAGWQARINDVLRKGAAKTAPSKRRSA